MWLAGIADIACYPGPGRICITGIQFAMTVLIMIFFLPDSAIAQTAAKTNTQPSIDTYDWPMWGGQPSRNMVSNARGLPAKWNVSKKNNIKWIADLGTMTYGNAAIGDGKIFVGTNNGRNRNQKIGGDKGILMCFAEADGSFLWQAVHDKLAAPMKYDWPEIGICSIPCVFGDRVFYVSNRCELICADTNGFHDHENDGPFKNEKLTSRCDADLVWRLDMKKDLGVLPLFASASGPMVVGELVLVMTGNGADADESRVPAPDAPSFIAVDRLTGEVVWQDNSPGKNILDGQWSSPAWGMAKGVAQAIFPGGDGWLYAFEPATGILLWKFNGKQPSANEESEVDEDESTFVGTPVFHEDKVFIALGQAPENCSGPGRLWAIDATQSGDVSKTAGIWCREAKDFECSASTVAICDGLLYAVESEGFVRCLDAATGKQHWRYDLKASTWASPLVVDGKVYVGNQDGDIYVFKHSKQVELLAVNTMNETVCSTVAAANGVLYIVGQKHLFAIAESRKTTIDWPMFRGNPQLTGVAESHLPAKLKLRWKIELPQEVESSAAIANKTAYVGCHDGFLYAIDLANGVVKWKYKANDSIRSSPCIVNNTLYFGDSAGMFHAVNINSRARRWTFRTDGEIISSANHKDDKILFGSYDGYLYCLAADDGKLIWKTETEGRIHGTPGIVEDKVLVAGCDEDLHVFQLADGTSTNTVYMGSFSGASAAINKSRVFVGTFNNEVIAIDWKSNKIVWTYNPPQRDFPFYGSAAVNDDLVVIGGRDKMVHAVDTKTGQVHWTFTSGGKIDSSPVIVGKRVFIGSTDGILYEFNLTSGKEIWRYETGSSFYASPAIGEDALVVGTEDGIIYCFSN